VRLYLIAVLLIALCGCASREPSACDGLVYKESGLERNEYLPCARAMVDELDRFHRELKTMGDKSLPKQDRRQAHEGCLASNDRLVKLIRQAGGRDKLAYVPWQDAELSRLNMNIIGAQTAYLVNCYYGLRGAETSNLADEEPSHVQARAMLAQLR